MFGITFLSVISIAVSAPIWPQPLQSTYGDSRAGIDPASFIISTSSTSSTPLLEETIEKYRGLFFPFPGQATANVSSSIAQLSVVVEGEKDPSPLLDINVDESYIISVSADKVATLTAKSVWGAMRGLESFSQLVDFDTSSQTYSIQYPTSVTDKPRFAWRGLLIDSARHFLTKKSILRTIDAMSYNKFNVLHWHLVDAQSFPLIVESLPDLAAKGSFHPTYATYDADTVKEIVEYGYKAGVRVVPEIDVPGHSYSWRFADAATSVVAECPTSLSANVNNYPLDPSKERTFEVVTEIWKQIAKTFSDDYVHIGGDEVVYGCWTGNADISAWMKEQGFKTGPEVFQYFMSRMFELIPATINKRMLVWEDVFNANLTIPKDVIVEIWSGATTLNKVMNAGYPAVNAYGWYLDKQKPYDAAPNHYELVDTWKDFYNYEPTRNITGDLSLLIGGEAAMWGEQVDETTLEERVWPRASAVGERLWSQQSVINVVDATSRLVTFRCTMARRGVRAGPIAPDYCPLTMSN